MEKTKEDKVGLLPTWKNQLDPERYRPSEKKIMWNMELGIVVLFIVCHSLVLTFILYKNWILSPSPTMPIDYNYNEISVNYNKLLNARGIFPAETKFVSDQRTLDQNQDILINLQGILSNRRNLIELYEGYKEIYLNRIKATHLRSISEFRLNLMKIARHNLEARSGLHTWEKGVNRFTDMSPENHRAIYTGFNPNVFKRTLRNSTILRKQALMQKDPIPESVNWVDEGKVASVKDQGPCSSCVIFASAGLMESTYAIAHDTTPLELSAQQILDCSQPNVNICKYGSADDPVLDYLENNGVSTLEDYPQQEDSQQHPCDTSQIETAASLLDWSHVPDGEEGILREVVVAPVSVGVYAPPFDYKEGIYSDCPEDVVENHAVLVVGYGSEGDEDYWLIKNSWGDSWGDEGYYKLKRNVNECLIGLGSAIAATAA